MPLVSAGLLMFSRSSELKVFLAHPGGPFFKNKDLGSWTIPKGLREGDEDPLVAAQREFQEETGIRPEGPFLELGFVKSKSGKNLYVWAFEMPEQKFEIVSNLFSMEWPPKSGKMQNFPEVDKAEWFNLLEGEKKINDYQKPFLRRLSELIKE
jgi:predicted NUDIX family NTP pyrophosphohydrolase